MEKVAGRSPDKFWPYRVGFPALLPSPPVSYWGSLEGEHNDWDTLSLRIREVCLKNGVMIRDNVILVWRWSTYLPGAVRDRCVLIRAHWDHNAESIWSAACFSLYELLVENDMSDFNIEIKDYEKTEKAFRFPVLSRNAAIVDLWDRKDDPLEETVRILLGDSEWHMISVIGGTLPTASTLVITVWSPRDLKWVGIGEAIRNSCNWQRAEVGEVVFLQAYDVRFADLSVLDSEGRVRDPEEFAQLRFGGSLEAQGAKLRVGTLGGNFVLGAIPVAVSCYHVFRTSELVLSGTYNFYRFRKWENLVS